MTTFQQIGLMRWQRRNAKISASLQVTAGSAASCHWQFSGFNAHRKPLLTGS